MICLSQRDDPDRVWWTFNERYEDDAAPNHPDAQPSFFVVISVCVGPNKKKAAKHFFRIGKIEPMLSDVRPVLALVPFEKSL
jgi:hypothetical protein